MIVISALSELPTYCNTCPCARITDDSNNDVCQASHKPLKGQHISDTYPTHNGIYHRPDWCLLREHDLPDKEKEYKSKSWKNKKYSGETFTECTPQRLKK